MVARLNQQIAYSLGVNKVTLNLQSRALLEILWNQDKISDLHFISGMSYGILQARAFRSFGIPSRLMAVGHLLEKLNGKSNDIYENFRVEKAWSYITKSLDPIYSGGGNFKSVLDVLIADKAEFSGDINLFMTKADNALDDLSNIWFALEKSKLRTNIPKKIAYMFVKI